MRIDYISSAQARHTDHARTRMQQRSIPIAVVDLLLDFGRSSDAGDGCSRYTFCKHSIAEIRQSLGHSATLLDRYLNAYVIVTADDVVVTAARSH